MHASLTMNGHAPLVVIHLCCYSSLLEGSLAQLPQEAVAWTRSWKTFLTLLFDGFACF